MDAMPLDRLHDSCPFSMNDESMIQANGFFNITLTRGLGNSFIFFTFSRPWRNRVDSFLAWNYCAQLYCAQFYWAQIYWAQLSERMQERHLHSKTLESIVQTRDVTAKIEIRNFLNQKIYHGTLGKWDWAYIYHFLIGFVLSLASCVTDVSTENNRDFKRRPISHQLTEINRQCSILWFVN